MVEKRKFDSFSRKQIAEMASEAGLRARKESLEAGLEVLSQNPETGEFICERLDAEGNLVKRKPTREEIEALKR